jgi:hypothetical protein
VNNRHGEVWEDQYVLDSEAVLAERAGPVMVAKLTGRRAVTR